MASPAATQRATEQFSEVIRLPNGFQPENIATGRGHSFFAWSLADGSIFGANLRSGQGAIVVPPQQGRIAAGLSVDCRTNHLFVAGGLSGSADVYDAETGSSLAEYQPTTVLGQTIVNDVIVTRSAAYFTDSLRP
jgi:hypothetical protein